MSNQVRILNKLTTNRLDVHKSGYVNMDYELFLQSYDFFLLKISANRDPTEHSQHHKDITQDYNDILKNHITKLDYTRFYLNEFYLAQILFIFCYDVSEKQ